MTPRTVVDLHPEELLDREARGELRDGERARLDAHLAHCATCRVERTLRADFAEELSAGDAPSKWTGLVDVASLGIGPVPRDEAPREEAKIEAPPVRTIAPRRRAVRTTWLLAAAAVLGVSVAAAGGVTGRTWFPFVGKRVEVMEGPSTLATSAAPRRVKSAKPPRVEGPAPIPAPTGDVLGPSAPEVPIAPPPAPPRAVTSTAAPRVAKIDPDAAALFDAASDARRHGDYARAVALHRDLESRYGASAEAQVSRATVGRLLLDRGDPSGALASFDAYLARGSGELGEEAMVGRATALERLGRADDAARAWGALLAAYPRTTYAAHAKARLGSTSGR